MDYPRSCSIMRARLISGSDVETWIRWYEASPDAAPLDEVTAFGHPLNEPRPWTPFEGPGCILQGSTWASKLFPGQCQAPPRGDSSAWANGIDATGPLASPICCIAYPPDQTGGAILPRGGVVIGGTGWPPFAPARLGLRSGDTHTASPLTLVPVYLGLSSADLHTVTAPHSEPAYLGLSSADLHWYESCPPDPAYLGLSSDDLHYTWPRSAMPASLGLTARDTVILPTFISTPCCASVPPVLTADVSGCTCLAGVHTTITWDPVNQWWYGTTTACAGYTISFRLDCAPGTVWRLQVSDGPFNQPTKTADSASCIPFNLTFFFDSSYHLNACPLPFTVSIY